MGHATPSNQRHPAAPPRRRGKSALCTAGPVAMLCVSDLSTHPPHSSRARRSVPGARHGMEQRDAAGLRDVPRGLLC